MAEAFQFPVNLMLFFFFSFVLVRERALFYVKKIKDKSNAAEKRLHFSRNDRLSWVKR